MQSLIDDSLADRRFIVFLLALTGCLALAMAVAGVYGVATYVTSRRTPEIGIRMALGATRGNVEVLIFRQGFVTATIGLTSGLAITLVSVRILRGMPPGLQSGNSARPLDGNRLGYADRRSRLLASRSTCGKD